MCREIKEVNEKEQLSAIIVRISLVGPKPAILRPHEICPRLFWRARVGGFSCPKLKLNQICWWSNISQADFYDGRAVPEFESLSGKINSPGFPAPETGPSVWFGSPSPSWGPATSWQPGCSSADASSNGRPEEEEKVDLENSDTNNDTDPSFTLLSSGTGSFLCLLTGFLVLLLPLLLVGAAVVVEVIDEDDGGLEDRDEDEDEVVEDEEGERVILFMLPL